MPQINLSFWYAISFFLIILSIGYITVEIILGKSYRFRDRIDTSKNPLFDRIMHYIIRGFLINGIILSLFPYIPCIEAIISKIVSWGLEIGQKLNPDNYTEISITISSFLYFFIFILLVTIEYVIITAITLVLLLGKKAINNRDTIKKYTKLFYTMYKREDKESIT